MRVPTLYVVRLGLYSIGYPPTFGRSLFFFFFSSLPRDNQVKYLFHFSDEERDSLSRHLFAHGRSTLLIRAGDS